MKVIAGLGNPGQQYSATRHNIGFMAVDVLAGRWNVADWRSKFEAQVAEYRGTETVLLVKPQTYMNLSGRAVAAVLNWYKLTASDLIVIYDELDLPAGRLRLRPQGGAGGHRGIESLFDHLGTHEFARVRLGIGRPPTFMEAADYVLGRFAPGEQPLIKEMIDKAAEAVECILAHGITKAMNEYNR